MKRRVLMIPGENGYITIAPDETAESYTVELGRKYRMVLVLSAGYILVYGAAWCVILLRQKCSGQRD